MSTMTPIERLRLEAPRLPRFIRIAEDNVYTAQRFSVMALGRHQR